MPTTYSTPGVYVQEISTFPPSVAEVSTAIPAFLGYTTKAASGLTLTPTRIATMREYEDQFGGPPALVDKVTVDANGKATPVLKSTLPLLYYSLRLYFDNGGGPCYIVSLGLDTNQIALADFKNGLAALEREDEPTLIVMPDATRLSEEDLGQAGGAALDHCGKMRDRFAILDLKDKEVATAFRSKLSSDYLAYGAAYTPHISTALTVDYQEDQLPVEGVKVSDNPAPVQPQSTTFQGTLGGLQVTYTGSSTDTPSAVVLASQAAQADDVLFSLDTSKANSPVLTVALKAASPSKGAVETAWAAFAAKGNFNLTGVAANVVRADATPLTAQPPVAPPAVPATVTLGSLKSTKTAAYNAVKSALSRQRVTLPPSGAVAGIYARVDRDRGVWKAPANVAVASVIELTQAFTDAEQGLLNVDPTSGKSINALRSFTGRGTLVWGARTLAGNDNEWRYIPVRRLFIMIEESAQKATAFAVFEPNTAETWLKVKAMIESYLYGLWEQGALAGSKPESAYFVNVGLGTTMTAQNILEGFLIVEIGIAAVRPAEFVVLRFSHKMQEA